MRYKLPVPEGFVLTASSLNSSQFTTDNEINHLFSKSNGPFIVRSSASLEDAIATSFAGQFESYYPINTVEELKEAIFKIKASRKSQKVISYLNHYNISSDDFNIAAVIQEYKKPIWSGVAFTDQDTGAKSLIVEMSQKAEGVVSGQDTPLHFAIDYSTKKIISKTGGENPSLTRLVEKVSELSFEIADKFKAPQDIEWVYDGKRVWIVQSRPITAQNLEPSIAIKEELRKLKKLLGARPPFLAASQFAEGLEHATPLTTSLFQKFYSESGSFGQIMRHYRIPIESFDAEKLVVNVLGRIFMNKDLEKKVLLSRTPRRLISGTQSSFATPLYQTEWYYPGLLKLTKMTPEIILSYLGSARLQIDTFRYYKKLTPILTAKKQEYLTSQPLTRETARLLLDHLVNETAPLMFKIALFQQCAYSYLEKKIRRHVSADEWQSLITTGLIDKIASAVQEKDPKIALQKVAYRGFQEQELSEPRFEETPEKFLRIFQQLKKTGAPGKISKPATITKIRLATEDKFGSIWDQQIISTYFKIYDFYSASREEMHDLWIREMSFLRKILLKLDRDERLYNSIWYATLDEALSENQKLNQTKLFATRKNHELMRRIPLGGTLIAKTWEEIIKSPIKSSSAKVFRGTSLTSGIATGTIGTAEMLESGERVDILILKNLDPTATIYFENIKGLITEVGGEFAHAAIVAREYGLPVMVLENATGLLKIGVKISLDCSKGTISILK
ncbi:MAG: PEP/pyruvate-binding domain-containing protein [bacterium]